MIKKQEEYQFDENGTRIRIKVIRSRRKTIALTLMSEHEAIVRAPLRLRERDLVAFLDSHRAWLFEKSSLISERLRSVKEVPAPAYVDLTKLELAMIKEKIVSKVDFWKNKMNVTVGRITIRDQKTRWGSCNQQGNLNFNYRLYYLSEELLDYVVIHELSHRTHMDHSAAFWKEVEKYCPDYINRRKQLKNYRIVKE